MTTPSQGPPPGVPLPQGPPPSNNRALLWVLGTVVALAVVFVGGGLYIASRIVRNVTVGPNGNVQVSTPAGEINVSKITADTTGLPVYPGAALQPRQGAQVQFEPSKKEGGGVGVNVATYMASASLNEVAGWYRKNLDPSFEERHGNQAEINDFGVVRMGHPSIAFVSKDKSHDRARIIALESKGDQTKIVLVRIGEREPQ